MACGDRLFYLANETLQLRDGLRRLQQDAMGLLGLFLQLLRQAPQESAWIWLLATSKERALQKADMPDFIYKLKIIKDKTHGI